MHMGGSVIYAAEDDATVPYKFELLLWKVVDHVLELLATKLTCYIIWINPD